MTASATVGKQKQYFHVQTKPSDIKGHKLAGVYQFYTYIFCVGLQEKPDISQFDAKHTRTEKKMF